MKRAQKIQHFSQLIAWEKAHALVLTLYTLTKGYPREELYGLVNQSRRAAVSISSNIAEGFVRTTRIDKLRFYWFAKSSLAELQSQMYVARDLNYLLKSEVEKFVQQSEEVDRLLSGLIVSAQSRNPQ